MNKEFDKKIFATRLKEARDKKQISQSDLSENVGVSPQAISNYENEMNKKLPSLKHLYKIANALNVSLDWLCGFESHSNYLMSLWSVLEQTLPSISFSENEDGKYAVLELKNNEMISCCQWDVANFIESYLQIKELEKRKLADEKMIAQLQAALFLKFQNLPELPDYNIEDYYRFHGEKKKATDK